MKVFDFTDGKKGRLLANVSCVNGMGGWLVRKGNKVFKVELANAPKGWAWHSGATIPLFYNERYDSDQPLTAEEFGVEAICFCSGEIVQPPLGWQWHVIGTDAWNREACKKGILKATLERVIEEEVA